MSIFHCSSGFKDTFLLVKKCRDFVDMCFLFRVCGGGGRLTVSLFLVRKVSETFWYHPLSLSCLVHMDCSDLV